MLVDSPVDDGGWTLGEPVADTVGALLATFGVTVTVTVGRGEEAAAAGAGLLLPPVSSPEPSVGTRAAPAITTTAPALASSA